MRVNRHLVQFTRLGLMATICFVIVFNSLYGSYCKRLRVMCPEHFKDSTVINDFEINIYTLNEFNFNVTEYLF